MFQAPKSQMFVKFGDNQAQFISIQGDGLQTYTRVHESSKPSNPLEQDAVLHLKPIQSFPVATDCSCLRSTASNLSARSRSNSIETKLANKFSKLGSADEEEEEDDDSLQLSSLFSTLRKFSSRVLNPLQARSVVRLARGYRGREELTRQHVPVIQEFLDCDSPPIQDAALITLHKLMSRKDNVEFLFTHSSEVLDCILSLASDAPTLEVQVSALTAIEQITQSPEFITKWEQKLEDIIYPLVHAITKNRESAEVQKLGSLAVMRNLSHSADFAAKVKQDILSQLSANKDNSKVKGLYLEILQENLELSKQRISTDILDNTLLPVLSAMLAEGPCKTQCQSLRLLICIIEDDVNRASVLSSLQTVALCVLCAKYSNCRKVCALSCHMIEELLNVRVVSEAKKFMECNSESIHLEEGEPEPANLTAREERVTSLVRKRSRAEAQLWRHFDDLIGQLVSLLEKQGCIYLERNAPKVRCELSLIGSINRDQLSSISSLISCFSSLCMWPLKRPRKSGGHIGDVDEFLALDGIRVSMNNLNHHHAMNIWTRVGSQIMAIFRQVIKRLPSPVISTAKSRPTTAAADEDGVTKDTKSEASKQDLAKDVANLETTTKPLESLLYPEEAQLLRGLVKFVFVMCVVSCYFKKPSQGADGHPASARSSNDSVEKRMKEELTEKEMCAERRVLRRCLVEEGVFYLVSRLISLQDSDIKTMSVTVLRLCLQPVNERALAASSKKSAQISQYKTRPQSARTVYDGYARQSLNQTLFKMGRPGVGQRPPSAIPYSTTKSTQAVNNGGMVADKPRRTRPASAKTVSFSRETSNISQAGSGKYSLFSPLTACSEKKTLSLRPGSALSHRSEPRPASRQATLGKSGLRNIITTGGGRSSPRNVTFNPQTECWSDTEAALMAPLDAGNNISQQCCERALLATGDNSLKGIFSTDLNIKKSSLLFLHDLVLHSKSETHMELSKLGCISKLVDFLRINDDDELLEITGLTITRMLVSSDRRICQLFNIHGGSNLLMALLHKQPTEDLKKAISSTLNTVNHVMHAAANSEQSSVETPRPAADIWEHIMQRWEGEDKVVAVLKQFL